MVFGGGLLLVLTLYDTAGGDLLEEIEDFP
jgi:hypothetical protein